MRSFTATISRALTRSAASLALVATTVFALPACDLVAALAPAPTPTATAAPTPTPAATRTATPQPAPAKSSAGPTAATAVTEPEAEQVVRDLFAAIDAEQWDRVRALTSEQARQEADGLIEQLQQAERDRNVRVNLVVTQLAITGRQPQPPAVRVDAEFTIEARVAVGPLSVTAQTTRGAAAFYVRRIDGRPIVNRIDGGLR